MKNKASWVAVAIVLCLPVLALAQAGPADSKSTVPPLRYESVFTDYRPWQDIPVGDWRAANQAVAPAPAVPKAATPASATGHEGHQPQGGRK